MLFRNTNTNGKITKLGKGMVNSKFKTAITWNGGKGERQQWEKKVGTLSCSGPSNILYMKLGTGFHSFAS